MRHLLEDPANTPTAIEQLRTGGDALFVKVYEFYREEFIRWGKNNTVLNEQDLEDVFQDAVIVLFKKLDSVKTTVVGYLWEAYKNKLYHKYRQHIRFKLNVEINDMLLGDWDDSIYKKTDDEYLKHIFREALKKIGNQCKKLLDLLFYKGYSPEAAKEEMGYKSVDVVYANTHKCLKRLGKIVIDKL